MAAGDDFNFEENHKQMLSLVKIFVSASLFRNMKFILDEHKFLSYSTDENSVAQQCIRCCNVMPQAAIKFWSHYGGLVRSDLIRRRNHCQEQMKRVFMSK